VKHAIAIAALVATSVGAVALPAVAQDGTLPVARKGDREIHRTVPHNRFVGRNGTVVSLVCSDRGAEALEIAFVRLSHRLELTDEQDQLFDALRTSALTAQTRFADTCAAALPDATADAAAPDVMARLKASLDIERARLDAMTGLLPDLEAFYASLTSAQQADMAPRRSFRMNRDDRAAPGRDAPGRDAPGRTTRPPAPGRS